MRKNIRDDIPREARIVFLKDQLQATVDSLDEIYSNYKALSQELKIKPTQKALPSSIKKSIEKAIRSNKLAKQQQESFNSWLLVLIVFILISLLNFGLLNLRHGTIYHYIHLIIGAILLIWVYSIMIFNRKKLFMFYSNQPHLYHPLFILSWAITLVIFLEPILYGLFIYDLSFSEYFSWFGFLELFTISFPYLCVSLFLSTPYFFSI